MGVLRSSRQGQLKLTRGPGQPGHHHMDYCDIKPIELACGATAVFDHESGISYRCTRCFAVVGSIGMPRDCAELMETQERQKRIMEILED